MIRATGQVFLLEKKGLSILILGDAQGIKRLSAFVGRDLGRQAKAARAGWPCSSLRQAGIQAPGQEFAAG